MDELTSFSSKQFLMQRVFPEAVWPCTKIDGTVEPWKKVNITITPMQGLTTSTLSLVDDSSG